MYCREVKTKKKENVSKKASGNCAGQQLKLQAGELQVKELKNILKIKKKPINSQEREIKV